MFKFADKDQDGKISFIEFQLMIKPQKPDESNNNCNLENLKNINKNGENVKKSDNNDRKWFWNEQRQNYAHFNLESESLRQYYSNFVFIINPRTSYLIVWTLLPIGESWNLNLLTPLRCHKLTSPLKSFK